MNWVGTNFMRIKNIELFSNDPQYSEGVFNTLLRNCGGDPHKAEVLITASNFDFQKFHNLSPSSYLSTLCDEDSPWFQVELCKGKAIVKGYRFQIVDNFPIHKWRFACSNDKESWDVIHESESPKIISSSIFVFEANSTKLYKYFRFINVSDNSEDDIKLKLRHFDIFGVYFSD